MVLGSGTLVLKVQILALRLQILVLSTSIVDCEAVSFSYQASNLTSETFIHGFDDSNLEPEA